MPGTVGISIFISAVVKGILPSQQSEAGRLLAAGFQSQSKETGQCHLHQVLLRATLSEGVE